MINKALKTIETLLQCLTVRKTSDLLIEDDDTFTNSKLHLFNLLTINTLLKYYDTNVPLKKDIFLSTGIVPGLYNEAIETPILEINYRNNADDFFKNMIESLKNKEFFFDEFGNIIIDNANLNTTIHPIWLHRLAETMEHYKYHNVYLFNKQKDKRIHNEEELITYLKQSKTFSVTMQNRKDADEVFNAVKSKTTNAVSQKGQLKIDDIIDMFNKFMPLEYQSEVSKFIMPSPVYIIKKVNELGSEFYTLIASKQQEYITTWLNEYLMINDISVNSLQKALMVKEPRNLTKLPYDEKQKSICALLGLLFTVLDYENKDYDTMSLSGFNIDTYLSDTHQETQVTLNEIITTIDSISNSKTLENTKKQIAVLMDEINALDGRKNRQELEQKQATINGLFNRYKKMETDQDRLCDKRNALQNVLHYRSVHDKDEIAFDNIKIAELIRTAVKKGQVLINPLDSKKISTRIVNGKTGKTTFEANIKIKDLLTLVEDLNFQLEEEEYKMAS